MSDPSSYLIIRGGPGVKPFGVENESLYAVAEYRGETRGDVHTFSDAASALSHCDSSKTIYLGSGTLPFPESKEHRLGHFVEQEEVRKYNSDHRADILLAERLSLDMLSENVSYGNASFESKFRGDAKQQQLPSHAKVISGKDADIYNVGVSYRGFKSNVFRSIATTPDGLDNVKAVHRIYKSLSNKVQPGGSLRKLKNDFEKEAKVIGEPHRDDLISFIGTRPKEPIFTSTFQEGDVIVLNPSIDIKGTRYMESHTLVVGA